MWERETRCSHDSILLHLGTVAWSISQWSSYKDRCLKGHAFGAELSKLCIPLKPWVLHIIEGRMAFFCGVFPGWRHFNPVDERSCVDRESLACLCQFGWGELIFFTVASNQWEVVNYFLVLLCLLVWLSFYLLICLYLSSEIFSLLLFQFSLASHQGRPDWASVWRFIASWG